MNLRELVAQLETEGKPVFSEQPVMVLTPEGEIYSIGGVECESGTTFEGQSDSVGSGTVWLKVDPV